MTGDPEQEYFVDGVTESLTTDLSRIGDLFVIGRNTALPYKGRHVNSKQIGRELNLAMSSMAAFSATATGCASPCSSSTPRAAIFVGPNGSTSPGRPFRHAGRNRFASCERAHCAAHRRRGSTRGASANPNSMDLCFQARAWWYKGITPDNLATAFCLYERALALDPANVRALVGVAAVGFSNRGNFRC